VAKAAGVVSAVRMSFQQEEMLIQVMTVSQVKELVPVMQELVAKKFSPQLFLLNAIEQQLMMASLVEMVLMELLEFMGCLDLTHLAVGFLHLVLEPLVWLEALLLVVEVVEVVVRKGGFFGLRFLKSHRLFRQIPFHLIVMGLVLAVLAVAKAEAEASVEAEAKEVEVRLGCLYGIMVLMA
jgi:hypothetical protein